MNRNYNSKRESNEDTISILIKQEGYIDLGWANGGKSFTYPKEQRNVRELDCSLFQNRATNIVYIDDAHKEILHVDMSD
ncbi:MAG: hypothetical protein H5T96_09515 [Tissierellales bacterium]|nr:hypothetical protein [Tissierellales bacterium]